MARHLGAAHGKTLPLHLPLAIAGIKLDLSSPIPLYEQVAHALRGAIDSGELPPGTAMPKQHELADVLGLGRNTVVAAYSRLVAGNYLVAHRRRGTRVAERRHGRDSEEPRTAQIAQGPGLIDLGYHAKRALDISIVRTSGVQPFALHAPDPALYPRAQLGKLIAEEMRHVPSSESGYGARGACSAFQTTIANHLRNARGVNCEPEQIIPVAGVESVLDIVARALIDPGHAVQIEDPAADIVRSAFLATGARLYPLSHDNDRACADTPPPRLIFVSPTISFPFGRQMPEARRLAILQFARASGAAIFEADTYGELVYAGGRQRAIQGHDREGRVFYFGSLSRTLGPGVRVSYMVVPPALVESFSELVRRVAYGPEIFLQSAIAKFIASGQYAMHVKAIRSAYAQRLQALIEACRRHIPSATVLEPDGGLHLSLQLDDAADEGAICRLAVQEDLQVAPLSHFYLNPGQRRGLVLGFGSLSDHAVEETVARLGSLIRQVSSFDRP